MPRITARRMGALAVVGGVLGLSALAAGVAGAGDVGLALAVLAVAALLAALIGLVFTAMPRPSRRRESYTGEVAWIRAQLAKSRPPREK
jgi:amino acid transporter